MNAPASSILLVGVGGMLARAFEELLQARGRAYDAPPLDVLDLTQPNTIVSTLTAQYQLVINTAAWTDVDGRCCDRCVLVRPYADVCAPQRSRAASDTA